MGQEKKKKKKTAKTGDLETQLKESKKEIVALQEDNTKLTAANAKLEIDNVTLQENLNRSEAAVVTSTDEVRKLRTKIVLVEQEKENPNEKQLLLTDKPGLRNGEVNIVKAPENVTIGNLYTGWMESGSLLDTKETKRSFAEILCNEAKELSIPIKLK